MPDLYDIMESARIDADEDIYEICEDSSYAIIQHDVLGGEFVITFTYNDDSQKFVYIDEDVDAEAVKEWLLEQGMKNKKIVLDLQ